MKVDLGGQWTLNSDKYKDISVTVPGSVLGALLKEGLIEDPFYRDNEAKVREVLYDDYTFTRSFSFPKEKVGKASWLFIEGVDTAAKIYINGCLIVEVCDMHLRQRIRLDNTLLKAENEIRVEFTSPYTYINGYDHQNRYFTMGETEKLSPCMRKANYMFGWDWGPNLADIGIYKDLYILTDEVGYLDYFRHELTFLDDGSVRVDVETACVLEGNATLQAELSLDGEALTQTVAAQANNTFSFIVKNPKLWYPAGYGEQPLYTLQFTLQGENNSREFTYRIGLREVKIDNTMDEYGLNFCVYVNGVKLFIKGANYIPQDNILERVTPERTKRLLKLVKDFNHNTIRVWGGGYYPEDEFYDMCDELGILISQDLMMACAVYNADDQNFVSLLLKETKDAVRRIRHHACIYMFNGNNECEDGIQWNDRKKYWDDYRKLTEEYINPLMKREVSQYFLRSSPTARELFVCPNNYNDMDMHYWEVWHGRKPFEAYTEIYPRMLSEFGCQSMPLYDTILRYAREDELDLFSPVMAHHQKNFACNDIILYYTKSVYGEPKNFKDLTYLSILAQAEGIKSCVEHLRRNKTRCNGAIYWQLNDCWPGQSWSSIDYYFGIKALHYYSKKFYAPHLVSVRADVYGVTVQVSNDTAEKKAYQLTYRFMRFNGGILQEQKVNCEVNGGASLPVLIARPAFWDEGKDTLVYVELRDTEGNLLSENFHQYWKDSEIVYEKPHLTVEKLDEYSFAITTDTYTKNIFIEAHDNNAVLSDNYFHLLKGQRKVITSTAKLDYEKMEITTLNDVEK